MVEKYKTKAIAAKRQRARKRISLSNEEEKNYEHDIRDKTDSDPQKPKAILKKEELGKNTSNESSLYLIGYDRQKSSLPGFNLFSLNISNPFCLNLA